jgi:dTMP kinase
MNFINIDGPNGVGKSTFIKSLVKELEETTSLKIYVQHFHRRDTLVGQTIQQVLNGEIKLNSLALQKLYSVDRLDFTKVKYEQLKEEGYDLLISDRYDTSGLAYGLSQGIDKDVLLDFDKHCVKPDLNIILVATVETLLARLKTQVLNEGETGDIFEQENKLKNILAGYSILPTVVSKCVTLNVTNGVDEYIDNVVEVCKGVCIDGNFSKYLHSIITNKHNG